MGGRAILSGHVTHHEKKHDYPRGDRWYSPTPILLSLNLTEPGGQQKEAENHKVESPLEGIQRVGH